MYPWKGAPFLPRQKAHRRVNRYRLPSSSWGNSCHKDRTTGVDGCQLQTLGGALGCANLSCRVLLAHPNFAGLSTTPPSLLWILSCAAALDWHIYPLETKTAVSLCTVLNLKEPVAAYPFPSGFSLFELVGHWKSVVTCFDFCRKPTLALPQQFLQAQQPYEKAVSGNSQLATTADVICCHTPLRSVPEKVHENAHEVTFHERREFHGFAGPPSWEAVLRFASLDG